MGRSQQATALLNPLAWSRAKRGLNVRRSTRAAAILAAICMVLAAGWARTAATAQAAGTALLLSSSPLDLHAGPDHRPAQRPGCQRPGRGHPPRPDAASLRARPRQRPVPPKGSRILFAWSTLDEGCGLSWVRPDGSGLETLEQDAAGAGSPRTAAR